jgi:hypothetical protein
MMLDGHAFKREEDNRISGDVHLDKTTSAVFEDDWDFVIENYTVGANDPSTIDSISRLTAMQPVINEELVTIVKPAKPVTVRPVTEKTVVKNEPAPSRIEPVIIQPVKPQTIEEKFTTRQKQFIKEIAISGDSVELRFYDNAEIDGDSISLFLNGKLLFDHIRLTASAYIIKLALVDLGPTNELIMVAENLGSIPPNTAYMTAIINGQRQEAYLASTEGSSAMIRLTKKE